MAERIFGYIRCRLLPWDEQYHSKRTFNFELITYLINLISKPLSNCTQASPKHQNVFEHQHKRCLRLTASLNIHSTTALHIIRRIFRSVGKVHL